MNPEKKEALFSPDEENIANKTAELTELLCTTQDYKRYEKHLKALKEQPEKYHKLNEFRRKHMELQLEAEDERYYERMEALYTEYKDILMESVVTKFLASEQSVCKMMRKIYDSIALKMNLDVTYMDET